MNITTSNLEALGRALLLVVIASIVAWAGDSANLTPFVNGTLALIISGFAGVLENQIKQSSGHGLFGLAR